MTKKALKLPITYALCVSQSERLLAAVGRKVVVVDLASRQRLHSTHPLSHPSHAAFSSDDRLLAVKSTWGEIAVLDAASGQVLSSYRPRHQDEGAAIAFGPGNKLLVDGSWSGEIRVRQVSELGKYERIAFAGEMIRAISKQRDGKAWLFAHTTIFNPSVSRTPPPRVSLWGWPLREPKSSFGVGLRALQNASLSPCGAYFAVVGYSARGGNWVLRTFSNEGSAIATVKLAE